MTSAIDAHKLTGGLWEGIKTKNATYTTIEQFDGILDKFAIVFVVSQLCT